MKKTLLATVALPAALACGSTFAQGYVGGAFGMTHQDVNCSNWSSCDKSDTGFKIYGGYKFTPSLALELGYTDFGSASLNTGGAASGSYSATALSVGGAFFLPLAPKLTGIGRLGLASVDADYSYSAALGLLGGGSSDSSIEPYVGLGLAYALTPKLNLTGTFDYMRASYPRGSGSATLLGVGLSYAF